MASLAIFLATIWVDDVALCVLEGGSSGVLWWRLGLHVVDRALVLAYTRVIGSLTSSARSFYYDFISDGFSENICMIVLVLIGIVEVMHILMRHRALNFGRSWITVVQARAL